MRSRVSILLFSILFNGCAATSPYLLDKNELQIHQCSLPVLYGVTEDTEKVFRGPIYKAFNYWNTVIERKVFINFGTIPWRVHSPYTRGFIPVSVLSRNDPWISDLESCGKTLLSYDINRCITSAKIAIVGECIKSLDRLNSMVRHEIGHVLGLNNKSSHTPYLMNKNVERSVQHPVDASEEEIKAVRRLYGLE